MRKILTLCVVLSAFAAESRASSITFTTPTVATLGPSALGPSALSVHAEASFVTSAGQVSVTLTNLQANPTDITQLISDLEFTLSNGITSGTLTDPTVNLLDAVNNVGVPAGTGPAGWTLNQNVSDGLQLDVLGSSVAPAHLIIGPGPYTNANGSIDNNALNNPFINQTVTFVITNAAITPSTTVTGATFSFGLTPVAVPEPTSLLLLGTGLIGAGVRRYRRLRS